MGKKPSTVAAFEIRPSCLKFVEMARNERRILSAGMFPLAPGRGHDREHLAAQVRSALDTAALGNVTRLIACVPLGEAVLRVIDVPDGLDARDHVVWELSQYLGRGLEDYAVDFQPENPVTDGADRYVAAAFPLAPTVGLRDTLEQATGLPLNTLDLDAAAVVNAFASAYPEFLPERVVLLHANTESTTVVRTHQGTFQGAVVRRDAGAALRSEAEAQERAEGLLRCARGIAECIADATDGWNVPDRVLLCGDLAVDADFKELLRARLPGGFSLLNPYRNMPGPDPADSPGAYPGALFAAATGIALRMAEES